MDHNASRLIYMSIVTMFIGILIYVFFNKTNVLEEFQQIIYQVFESSRLVL